MFKPATLIIALILLLSGYWFYANMVTPQGSNIRVSNLPWQITVIDADTLRVFDVDIGRATLAEAVAVLKSEYKVAWFENPDNTFSLEAYFLRVNLSGLRAKVVLELDTEGLTMEYLKKNSGKAEILASRAIKYPLANEFLQDRLIRSLTYIPTANLDSDVVKQRFGLPTEQIALDEDTQFWLYPQKGLVITVSQQGRETFQYVPVSDFQRLRNSVAASRESANKAQKLQ